MAELVPYRTKREIAIAALRDAVLSGRYPAGVRLEQNRIAAELGLSPTPVREAFRELLARGLLVQQAHHSVRVAEINLDDLRHLYSVRSLLEAEAARLAAAAIDDATLAELRRLHAAMAKGVQAQDDRRVQDADARFHALLYRASGNPYLADLIAEMWSSFPRYLLWVVPGRTDRSIAEHGAILDAALRRDPEAAAAAVRHHLQAALATLEANFDSLMPLPSARPRRRAAGDRP
jgi:DNA-binding GntR family transcriptional regulator